MKAQEIEDAKKRIEKLRREADYLLELRASVGRGFRRTTDDYLEKSRRLEEQADELERTLAANGVK